MKSRRALSTLIHVTSGRGCATARRALLRRRPDVTSWRDLLERARDEYERQSLDELVAS